MRELHVVAVSEDGRSVVLATSRGATRGGFWVAIDDRLTSAVQGDLARPGDVPPVEVTPKQIQARLRAGESVEEIAATAGVPIGKIERYAGPVLSERERILGQVRSAYAWRSRLGASALPLGEAVDRQLADTTGVRPETVSWLARREEVGTWLVEVRYVSQARRRTASWRYDVARREVTATDSASAQLAHVEPGREVRGADAVLPAPATPAERRAKPRSRRPATEPTRRTAPVLPTIVARSDGSAVAAADRAAPAVAAKAPAPAPAPARAAAVAPALAPAKAAAAAPSAPAKAARAARAPRAARVEAAQTAEADRALAAARAAQLAAAGRAASGRSSAQEAAAQTRHQAKVDAERASTRKAAARAAKAEADRAAKAEESRAAKAEAARAAKAEAARRAKSEAARKAKQERTAAEAAVAEAARLAREAEQVRVDVVAEAPSGPPTLRVVGGDDAPPRRGSAQERPQAGPQVRPQAGPQARPQPRPQERPKAGPKAAPAAARTAPARAAGQRASVPGWADVLLSTAPVRAGDADQDQD